MSVTHPLRAALKARNHYIESGLVAAAMVALGLVATVQAYVASAIRGTGTALWDTFLWLFPLWGIWALLVPLVLGLARHIPIRKRRLIAALTIHLLVSIVVAGLHSAAAVGFNYIVFGGSDASLADTYTRMLNSRFQYLILFYWAVVGVEYLIDYYYRFRDREVAASQLEAQLASAQLQALKMQLHPHFLFNTLHAVGVLIREDPLAAEQMVAKLGDFLRHTVDTMSVQEIPLKEELEFLRLYLDIEQTRFQDRLTVRYDIGSGTLDAMVPSFILQPLVENSIKHGVARHAGDGEIVIASERTNGRLSLLVSDSGSGGQVAPAESWTDGVGLRTTRERLARLYERHEVDCAVEGRGARVTLRIPYRPIDAPELRTHV